MSNVFNTLSSDDIVASSDNTNALSLPYSICCQVTSLLGEAYHYLSSGAKRALLLKPRSSHAEGK
jgi:hypothetical protein